MNNNKPFNSIDLKVYTIELRDGIFFCRVKEFAECKLEDVKELVEAMGQLGQFKRYPMITTVEAFASTVTKAKKFMASKETNKYLSASAVLTNQPGYMIGTNLFIKFFRPEIPTRLFLNEVEAKNWLKQFQ